MLKRIKKNNPRNQSGDTPLHKAAYHNQLEVVKCLYEAVEDKNPKNKEGKTPLDVAGGVCYYCHRFQKWYEYNCQNWDCIGLKGIFEDRMMEMPKKKSKKALSVALMAQDDNLDYYLKCPKENWKAKLQEMQINCDAVKNFLRFQKLYFE